MFVSVWTEIHPCGEQNIFHILYGFNFFFVLFCFVRKDIFTELLKGVSGK